MNARLPEFIVIVDMVGFGLTFWFGLHLLTESWGWRRGRAWQAALTAWSLALLFLLAVVDDLSPLAGVSVRGSLVRLALLPFPLAWATQVLRAAPGVLQPRFRLPWLLALVAGVLALGVNLLMGPLQPERLQQSWWYLPVYGVALLVAMGVALLVARSSRRIVGSALEHGTMPMFAIGSVVGLLGGLLLATDLVFGLHNPPLPPAIAAKHLSLRLVASLSLLLTTWAFLLGIFLQARAEGATRLSTFHQGLLVTLALALCYGAIGEGVIWYWMLPQSLLALFFLLALLTDPLSRATRARVERTLYRGESGTLRRHLRAVADELEAPPRLPPTVRPLLSHLARQLNTPQLGLALWDEKEFRIVAALRSSWEGQALDVPQPDSWQERGIGGWNMPVRHNHKTIAIIASETAHPLSPVQVRLLEDAALELARLLTDGQTITHKQEALQRALDDYRQHRAAQEARLATIAAPTPMSADLRRDVQQVLARLRDPAALGNHPLTKMKVVESSLRGASGRGEILQELVTSLVEQLRPFEGEPPPTPTPEWYPFLVLRGRYLTGDSPETLLERYQMTRKAYDQAHRVAVERVARTLSELEGGVARQLARAPKEEARGGAPTAPTAPTTAWGGASYGTGATGGGAWGGGGNPTPTPAMTVPTVSTLKPDTSRPPDKQGGIGGLTSRLRGEAPPPAAGSAPPSSPTKEGRGGLGGLTSRLRGGQAAPSTTPDKKSTPPSPPNRVAPSSPPFPKRPRVAWQAALGV